MKISRGIAASGLDTNRIERGTTSVVYFSLYIEIRDRFEMFITRVEMKFMITSKDVIFHARPNSSVCMHSRGSSDNSVADLVTLCSLAESRSAGSMLRITVTHIKRWTRVRRRGNSLVLR